MSQIDLWRWFLQETQTSVFQVSGCLEARIVTLSEWYNELLTDNHALLAATCREVFTARNQ